MGKVLVLSLRGWDRVFSGFLRVSLSDESPCFARDSHRFSLMYSCMTCRRTWVELFPEDATSLLSMN